MISKSHKLIIGIFTIIIIVVIVVIGLYYGGVFSKKKPSPTSNPGPDPNPQPTSNPNPQPTSNPGPQPTSKCNSDPSGINPEGQIVKINDGVSVYMPKVSCTPVTCMAEYGGQCQSDGTCKYSTGYKPLLSYPKALATNYCGLEDGGCSGAMGDPRDFINNLKKCMLAGNSPEKPPNGPIDENTRFGVTANPPVMIGDSAESYDYITKKQVTQSYQGSTPYSGMCYDVKGPKGRAILVPYDRCAGYCKAGCGVTPGTGNIECGSCLQKPEYKPKPNCPCVGTTPLDSKCCGMKDYGCPAVDGQCDWCASQNHPHFDLDNITFNTVCDSSGIGSCELTTVKPFKCIIPQKMPGGGGGGGGYVQCPSNSWDTGKLGPDASCTSGKYLKPGDPEWANSSTADHWCCIAS